MAPALPMIRFDETLVGNADAFGNATLEWVNKTHEPIDLTIVDMNPADAGGGQALTAKVLCIVYNQFGTAIGHLIQDSVWGFGGVVWTGHFMLNQGDKLQFLMLNSSNGATDLLYVKWSFESMRRLS